MTDKLVPDPKMYEINHAKYLLNLAFPYMQTILATDYMESYVREHWIKEACKLLGREDDGKRHPVVMQMMAERSKDESPT